MAASGSSVERGVGKERTLAFSDGVFAIAITLLVLNIEIPALPDESSGALDRALDAAVPDIVSYFIGFYVIGKFWLAHHRLFDDLDELDGRLMNANLLFLAMIALLPFPTGMLGEHAELTTGVVAFAAAVSLAGFAETLLLVLAHRKGMLGSRRHGPWRAELYEALSTPAVFLASIPIAFASPDGAKYFWLVLIAVRVGGARLGLRSG